MPFVMPSTRRYEWSRRDNALRLSALAIWLLICVVIVLSLAVWMARGSPRLPVSYAGSAMGTTAVVMTGIVFATVAAYMTSRSPRNLIGWIFLAIGLGMAAVLPINIVLADAVRQFRLADAPVVWLAWGVTSMQIPTSGTALVIVLLLFPAGRPEWRHGRLVMGLAVLAGALLTSGAALRPEGLIWYPTLPNPIAVGPELRPLLNIAILVGAALEVAALCAAGCWLVWRSRHAGAAQRRQLAWIVVGGLALIATLAPLFVARYAMRVSEAMGERLVFAAALGGIVFSVAVAVACHREGLFGLRSALGRSLVSVPLMALLGGLYAAAVALFQKLFVAFTGNTSDAAVVLATLLVAASLTPARQFLESIVRRATEGRVPDPAGAEPSGSLAGGSSVPMSELLERLERLEMRLAAAGSEIPDPGSVEDHDQGNPVTPPASRRKATPGRATPVAAPLVSTLIVLNQEPDLPTAGPSRGSPRRRGQASAGT